MQKKDKAMLKSSTEKIGRPTTHTPEFIKSVSDDLLKWSQKEDSLFLSGFLADYKVSLRNQTFSEWEKTNADFSETFYKVKQGLLNRLLVNACFKKLDGSFVAKILPLVDQEYRAWRREELRLERGAKAERFMLYIHPDRIPSATEKTKMAI